MVQSAAFLLSIHSSNLPCPLSEGTSNATTVVVNASAVVLELTVGVLYSSRRTKVLYVVRVCTLEPRGIFLK